jgi:holliday junction DNA helicase RuvB
MDDRQIGTDVNQVQITSLSKIRGQTKVTDLLRVNLDSHFQSRSQGKPSTFGPVLLCGPSGTGKSLVAKAIHAELGNTELLETNGEMLSNAYELISILVSATGNTSIFVDEAQGMSQRSMHIWLTALSERVVYLPQQGSKRRRVIPLENFAVLMATTHEYCLSDALRNRFRIYCRFEYYSLNDLVGILRQRCRALGWGVESDDVLMEIAKRSKKTPRIALNRNLQMAWSVCCAQGRTTITMEDTFQAFRFLNINNEWGLDELENNYLKVLRDNGPTALNMISSKLSLPVQTIRTVLEPYLIQEGFVAKESNSHRKLTQIAEDHLERLEPF